MPIKIAICDDEKNTREYLYGLVEKQGVPCSISLFASGEALLETKQEFDVTFLDIQMGALSGIQTAREIRGRQESQNRSKSVIIFVTGLPGHTEDAFDVNAYHYLIKPIREDKFAAVFEKAVRDCESRRAAEPKYILLQNKEISRRVYHRDILYVESRNKKVELHCIDEMLEHYATMEEIQRLLGSDFFRCHRCCLVNIAHIRGYNATTIELPQEKKIPLAQKKYALFVQTYMTFSRSLSYQMQAPSALGTANPCKQGERYD